MSSAASSPTDDDSDDDADALLDGARRLLRGLLDDPAADELLPRLIDDGALVRTDADGSFRLTGPSPDDVSLALRVETTGKVVALPRRQGLLLPATR